MPCDYVPLQFIYIYFALYIVIVAKNKSIYLSIPSRKENYATETYTINETNTSILEEVGPDLPGHMTCCGESRKEATMQNCG